MKNTSISKKENLVDWLLTGAIVCSVLEVWSKIIDEERWITLFCFGRRGEQTYFFLVSNFRQTLKDSRQKGFNFNSLFFWEPNHIATKSPLHCSHISLYFSFVQTKKFSTCQRHRVENALFVSKWCHDALMLIYAQCVIVQPTRVVIGRRAHLSRLDIFKHHPVYFSSTVLSVSQNTRICERYTRQAAIISFNQAMKMLKSARHWKNNRNGHKRSWDNMKISRGNRLHSKYVLSIR